ncbi:hypothetical protein JK636_22310 [Clostridium sp. YIM B02515]|uniref:Uncharacterized protein n=1 Tax=Clostridium rhizosphaerae TaxID=2803861 RepID=A0ABS1TGE8_9CLOT|nr:hypothetical protein [Clostridium rhizosphaerae]MBL4938448.1 hypothetical protein [Clostridium rhizosphaerae]
MLLTVFRDGERAANNMRLVWGVSSDGAITVQRLLLLHQFLIMLGIINRLIDLH